MEQPEIKVNHIETKSVMTKSNTPLGGYSVNPYVGCPHACKYCYASFMKRFTGHTEPWGSFMDVKHWPAIKDPKKYAGQKIVIGTVTDGYNPLEETYQNTRKLLSELKDSGGDIVICTKSDLVLRDLDLLTEINKSCRLTVSWSVNTLDEAFKDDISLNNKNEITISRVQKTVAEYYGLSKTQLLSKNKAKSISDARSIAIYLCRKHLDVPYSKLGNEFGRRDHSTIMSAYNKIEKNLEKDITLKIAVNEIEKLLMK